MNHNFLYENQCITVKYRGIRS